MPAANQAFLLGLAPFSVAAPQAGQVPMGSRDEFSNAFHYPPRPYTIRDVRPEIPSIA